MVDTLYTVGHSNRTIYELLMLLQLADINCVVDVRSVPASSYAPQFNKEPLSMFLKRNNIYYMHFGEEFGARRNDSVIDGQVNFEVAAKTEKFQQGVARIYNGLKRNFHIAFMCSEANPLSCHRFSLVSRYFFEHDVDVKHILCNKEIKTHSDLEAEMIEGYLNKRKLPPVDEMFHEYTVEDQRLAAYRLKNQEIGYKPGNTYENNL